MKTIYAPTAGFSGRVAGVQFADGKGQTDNPGALAFFRRRGYGIGSPPARQQPGPDDDPKPGSESTHVDAATSPDLTPTTTEPVAPAGGFDPSEHGVDEVNAYIADADADEQARVIAAERQGKARRSILDGPHARKDA